MASSEMGGVRLPCFTLRVVWFCFALFALAAVATMKLFLLTAAFAPERLVPAGTP
jgi:hypothetical protein